MSSHPARSLWYDAAWPVLAGVVTAAGLVSAYLWMGLAVSALALALLELTFAPVMWSVLTDLGIPARDVIVRISPMWSVGSLALVGLLNAFAAWSLVAAGLLLVTSPLVEGWSKVGSRGLMYRYGLSSASETDRRFSEIVTHGFPGLPDEDQPPR
jgi:NAD/NADP transhydrogenase beta subunit